MTTWCLTFIVKDNETKEIVRNETKYSYDEEALKNTEKRTTLKCHNAGLNPPRYTIESTIRQELVDSSK